MLDNPELAASLGRSQGGLGRRAGRAGPGLFRRARGGSRHPRRQRARRPRPICCWPEQQNARAVALAARDFASRQELDESTASLAKAEADLDLKRAQHAAASAGPTAEERALADARVALAEATVADLQAKLDKTRLVAPVDGIVGMLVAELGEVVPVGKPVLIARQWASPGSPSRCARMPCGS